LLPVLLFACSGVESSDDVGDFDPAWIAEVQGTIDDTREDIMAPAAVVTVRLADGRMASWASGLADIETEEPVTVDHVFRFGSITKTFVAAAALELVDEGVLELDASLAAVLPGVPLAEQVSLRQTLGHTTGIPDYVSNLTFLADIDQDWPPESLLDLVDDEPLLFEPGTGHDYSNSNYVLIGMAIEAVTGQDYGEVLRERYLEPLNLDNTFIPTIETIDAPEARGYLGVGDEQSDVTDSLNPTGPWAAGEMAADLADVLSWAMALYGGDVLTEAQLDLMTTPVETSVSPERYGMGCQIDDFLNMTTVGHAGSTYGFQSRLRYVETDEGTIVVATMVNSTFSEADDIDEAVWALLP